MGSGVSRSQQGIQSSTGAILQIRALGFSPTIVHVQNMGAGLASVVWCADTVGNLAHKRVAAGTGTAVADIITATSDGFDISVEAGLNVSGQSVSWQAYEATNRG